MGEGEECLRPAKMLPSANTMTMNTMIAVTMDAMFLGGIHI